jgi:hypothetical protein
LNQEGLIDDSICPQSWSRFADNVWSLAKRWKGGSATAPILKALVDDMASEIRRGNFQPALSGSLYQAVLAFAASHSPTMLTKTHIVPSSELHEIYGLAPLQRIVASSLDDDAVEPASENPEADDHGDSSTEESPDVGDGDGDGDGE